MHRGHRLAEQMRRQHGPRVKRRVLQRLGHACSLMRSTRVPRVSSQAVVGNLTCGGTSNGSTPPPDRSADPAVAGPRRAASRHTERRCRHPSLPRATTPSSWNADSSGASPQLESRYPLPDQCNDGRSSFTSTRAHGAIAAQ